MMDGASRGRRATPALSRTAFARPPRQLIWAFQDVQLLDVEGS